MPRIAAIEACTVDIPMRDGLATSRHAYDAIDCLIVRVTLSTGHAGFGETRENKQITGETRASILAAIRDELGPALLGVDAEDLATVHRCMARTMDYNTGAKSAIDMALHDAIGLARGTSVAALLGGAVRGPIKSSKAIGVGGTEAMVARARRYVEDGFETVKIKTGSDADAEKASIAAIREACGPKLNIKLDANQGWSLPEATRFLREVERYDIQVVEQPLPAWDIAGTAELRRRTSIPIMLDEAVHSPEDAFRAISGGACDYVNLKLVKTAGLYPAKRLVGLCESAGVACQIGTLDTSIGSAAAAHLVHACPNIVFAEINGPSRLEFDLATGVEVKNGACIVSDGPGLGIEVDMRRLPFGGREQPRRAAS
jgi:L-alanine-DL-glutamate epimerase-like enolase superfamily enzyme